jgi:hypothetical protein
MIVEIIGPGGVGKTTIEPLVAARLGIAYYHGRKRHGIHGEAVKGWKLWSGRIWSVIRRPGLSIAAVTTHPGSWKERAWFVMDICRREWNLAQASHMGSGVIASGPIHAMCMMSAATGADLSSILPHVTKADVYVRLGADPAEVTRRLAGRLGQLATDLDRHVDWIAEYEAASGRALQALDRQSIDVEADASPNQVADEVARRIRPFLG